LAVTSASDQQTRDFIYSVNGGLDLDPVIALVRSTYPDWNDAAVALAVKCYRDFLWVCWNYDRGGRSLAAISVLADEVWHCHMLLPAKYRDDCAQIFGGGHILDHNPVLPSGQTVSQADEDLARAEYTNLGVDVPTDLRDRCVWSVLA
jgi:hypothetical protein